VWGYGVYAEIIALLKCIKSLLVFILYLRREIIQPRTDIFGDNVTERNVSLLFSGELDNYFYGALLSAEEERNLVFLTKFASVANS
jgi:hypothetical protein